jgi:hypothetical protein
MKQSTIFRPVKHGSELDKFLTSRETLLKAHPLHVHVRGGDLSERDRKRLESEIQDLVTTELEHLYSLGPEKHSIAVSLKGLPVADSERILIESKVQRVVATKIPEGHRPLSLCVCGCGWPLVNCCDAPGTKTNIGQVCPLPSQPRPYWVAIYFSSEDVVAMEIEEGAAFNLSPTQMRIGLAIWPGDNVTWGKEVQAWTACGSTTLYVDGKHPGPFFMIVDQDHTDTLVFRKAKLFGVMTDMYNFDPPSMFWPCFGGKSLTFFWRCDVAGCGGTVTP